MRNLHAAHPSFCKNDSARLSAIACNRLSAVHCKTMHERPPHGGRYATVQLDDRPVGVIEVKNKQTHIAMRPPGRAPSFLHMTGSVAVQQESLT